MGGRTVVKLFGSRLAAAIVAVLCSGLTSHAEERKALSPAQQGTFLSKRTSGSLMGTFDSYCSLLYAVHDVAIHSGSEAINQVDLSPTFPDFYKPTWRELFDTIGRQTKSSWKYDASRSVWVFGAPPQPLGFEVRVSKGWKVHDEGLYVGYQPATAPVGMDIYMLGGYSAGSHADETALFGRVREALAVQFASNFKKGVSGRDMKEVAVGDLSALYFQAAAPTGIIWRQWVAVESGRAFAIVSAIRPEQERDILPDVLKMVASFRVSGRPQ
jgi:hypothetical protein